MRRPGSSGEAPLAIFFFAVVPLLLFVAVVVASFVVLSSSSPRPALVGAKNPSLSTESTVPAAASPSAGSPGELKQTVLYAGSRDHPGRLVLHPIQIDVGQGPKEQVDRVVHALQGPFDDPRILPTVPKGTRLLSVFVARKRLIVNLSREFSQMHVGGSQGARLTVHSLVDSLIDLGIAEEVQILIQGREEIAYADHVDISRPIGFQSALLASRAVGGEVAEGPKPEERPSAQATPAAEPQAAASAEAPAPVKASARGPRPPAASKKPPRSGAKRKAPSPNPGQSPAIRPRLVPLKGPALDENDSEGPR